MNYWRLEAINRYIGLSIVKHSYHLDNHAQWIKMNLGIQWVERKMNGLRHWYVPIEETMHWRYLILCTARLASGISNSRTMVYLGPMRWVILQSKTSNILSTKDDRNTKKFTIFITIEHMTSCKWWKCGPTILPASLTTHYAMNCDKNCELFCVPQYRRRNALPHPIYMFRQRIPLDPKDFFFFFFWNKWTIVLDTMF